MATKFITPSWRMPKNSNQSKASNYSIDFDGTSQYIDLNPGHTFAGSFGISAWFKNDILGGKGMLLGQGVNDNNSFIWGYNTTRFYIPFSGSTATFNNDGNNPIPTSGNGWAHVAMWRDDSNTVHCYLNGQDFGTLNKVNTTQTNPFTFDRIGAAATAFWDGDIGQISVFDYALTTESVSALYNNGIPANPLAVTTPPIAYYNLGQGSAYASGSAGIVEPNLAQATGSTVFEFDGSDLIVASTDMSSELNQISGSISVSCWAKTTQTTVYKYLLVRSRLGGPTKDQGWSFTKDNFYGSGGRMIFSLTNTNGDVMQVRLTGTNDPQGNPLITMNDGEWHHLSATYNRSTSTINLYTDGVLQGTTTTSGFGDYPIPTFGNMEAGSGGSRTCIGGWNNGSTMSSLVGSWIGEVSNTQIWDESLTTAEILTLYNNGTPLQSNIPQSGSLKAWYKLGLDNSIYNSDDTKWNVQNNFQTPIYNDSLKFFGSYVGGSPSISYPQLRTTTTSISPGTNGITYSAFIRIPLPVQGSETTLFYANLGSIQVSNKVTFKTETGAKYKNFNKDLEDGAWHHVLVYVPTPDGDGNLNDVKCYVDGGEITSTSIIGGSTYVGDITNVYGIYVGNLPPRHMEISNWAYWLGDKTSDVATIYNGGTPGDISSLNPDVWYKLDSDNVSLTGSNGLDYGSAVDSSGNSNNGRIGGEDASTGGPVPIIVNNYPIIANNGVSSGMDSTNLVPSNLIKSIPYSGYSMEFHGTDDYITASYSGNVNACSIWFKPENTITTSTQVEYLISFGNEFSGVLLGSSTSGLTDELITIVNDDSGIGRSAYTASSGTISDSFHHLCFNWSGTVYEIWLDGINVQNVSNATPALINSSAVQIGRNSLVASTVRDFNGNISNTAIFDRALTQDEILRIYNGGSPGNLSNLNPTSWWSLGSDSYFDGTNWICPDIGSNSNNGTSVNLGAEDLKGDGPDSLANGTSTNLDLASDLIGEAPGSTGNAISINMNSLARTGSTP